MFQTAVLWHLLLAVAAGGRYEVVHERGIASQYIPWKKSRLVPNARYAGAWNQRPTPQDLVCAHRWLPFGTVLKLTWLTARRSSYCVVLDRGPFGSCIPSANASHKEAQCPKGFAYRIVTRRQRVRSAGGFYRGVIDATPRVHERMRSPGWIWVKVERLVGNGRLLASVRSD